MNLFKLIIEFIKQQIKEKGLGKYLLSVFLTILISAFECTLLYFSIRLFGINFWFGVLGIVFTLITIFLIYYLPTKFEK